LAAAADGVSQGGAGPDEFRSAPLWGLGQRIFLLHERTSELESPSPDDPHFFQAIAEFRSLKGVQT
jgi:hypothetical protein